MILGSDEDLRFTECFREIDEAVHQMTYASGKIVVFNGHRFAGPPGAIVYSLENLHAHPEWRVPSFRGQIWDYNKAKDLANVWLDKPEG